MNWHLPICSLKLHKQFFIKTNELKLMKWKSVWKTINGSHSLMSFQCWHFCCWLFTWIAHSLWKPIYVRHKICSLAIIKDMDIFSRIFWKFNSTIHNASQCESGHNDSMQMIGLNCGQLRTQHCYLRWKEDAIFSLFFFENMAIFFDATSLGTRFTISYANTKTDFHGQRIHCQFKFSLNLK